MDPKVKQALLEQAAKAMCFEEVSPLFHSDDDGYQTSEFWCLHVKFLSPKSLWDPLKDDGDSFRLMIALNIRPFYGTNYVSCQSGVLVPFSSNRGAKEAATRLSILLAAAASGEVVVSC